MNETIIEQLAETFKQDFDIIQNDLGALEQAVKEKMRLLGQGLLQRMVNSKTNGYNGSSIACKCRGSMKFIQHRNKDIHTLFGWIKVRRAYYHCSDCGKSVFPYDVASGLGSEQLSPGLAKACSLVAIDDSFEQTSRKLDELFGQKVSDTQTGFRALTKKTIDCLDLYSDGMGLSTVFLTEAAKRGFRITEFPTIYRPRNDHSKSKLNRLMAGWEILRILLLGQA